MRAASAGCSQTGSSRTSPSRPAGPSREQPVDESQVGNGSSEPAQPSHYLYVPNNAGMHTSLWKKSIHIRMHPLQVFFVGLVHRKMFFSSWSIFSRSEQPQLPPLCRSATSRSRAPSRRRSYPGAALRPAALCSPLPLPPDSQRPTTARLWRPQQTELQPPHCDVTGSLYGGGGAVRRDGSTGDEQVAGAYAVHSRTEQAVRFSRWHATLPPTTMSDSQRQHTRTPGKTHTHTQISALKLC